MSGQITSGDAERLDAVVNGLPRTEYDFLVVLSLNSPGGEFAPALELAQFIAERGYGTYVGTDAQCLSGCALAFMAGRTYGEDSFAPRRSLEPGAILGFHAPFVFDPTDDGIAPEIARTLLPDAERAAALAAAEMVQLSLDEILPVSLVRELLTYESQTFLYVETIDQLGRWAIDIAGAEVMKAPDGLEPAVLRQAAARYCENYIFWRADVAFEDRETDQRFGPMGSKRLGSRCQTETDRGVYRYAYQEYETGEKDQGPLFMWQTLDPNRKFAALTPDEISGPYSFRLPFDPRDEPPSQIDGDCVQGFQWVGGWSGFAWSESIASASFRSCAGSGITQSPLRIECRHGETVFDLIFDSKFLPKGLTNEVMKISVDGKVFPAARGKMQDRNGVVQYVGKYGRGHPLFQAMRSGQMVTFQISGFDLALHLADAGKTIGNMEASCL